jgi:hypothetical protein
VLGKEYVYIRGIGRRSLRAHDGRLRPAGRVRTRTGRNLS